jgi:transposase
MDIRKNRGKELFETQYIIKKKGLWVVPSSQSKRTYSVNLAIANSTCTCPDFKDHGNKCKHIHAAELAETQKNSALNITTSKPLTVARAPRKTYPQDGSAYRMAQRNEKGHVMELLAELCGGINLPQTAKTQTAKIGRPAYPLSDAVYCAIFKVYGTLSGNRNDTDMRILADYGFIEKAPDPNTVLRYLQSPILTSILRDMIVESSRPLVAIEEYFAVDSTGFSVHRFDRWFPHKWGKEKQRQGWVKCHLMCGVTTNIVTGVEISDEYAHDTNYLHPLAETTANNFHIKEISADSAYLSMKNVEKIVDLGATPYIAFKSNTTGCKGGAFKTMYHRFKADPDKYRERYHQRSNVESTFSTIKRLFGGSLRSKTETAMQNEVLCKVLCHNLVVLIHEMYKQDIEPVFWTEKTAA